MHRLPISRILEGTRHAARKPWAPASARPIKSLTCRFTDGTAEHKVQKQCSGKRKRTAYISLPDFTERQLVQDYRLLEETQRAQVGRSAGPD